MNRYCVKYRRATTEMTFIEVDAKNEDEALELADEELANGGQEWEVEDSEIPDVDEVRVIGQS